MPAPLLLALHNPSLLPPDVLLAEFTARRSLLTTLLDIIRHNGPGQPPQHALLIGARGMGKTTTLWAVAYSLTRDSELSRQWQPVVFDEESRRVGDLADFWLEAIRQWEHATHDSANRAGHLLDTAGPNIEENAKKIFLETVDRSGRRALLLVDNINEVFASIREPEPLHRLRAFLMEDARVMIVGCATRYFKEITDLDQPFYDFFRVFDLKPLSLEEMKDCLLALAGNRGDERVRRALEERKGTIKALHLLTGGNPRLIKTFYRLLAEGLRGDIRANLEHLLDEFTPYFKAIVDALPVQQQRILDAVALAWDPVEVAAVSRETRVPSNQVSAQLRALIKAGLVAEAAGSPKRKIYLLADRFSNIHYLMRHGRAARNRFDWFVRLVQLIFPDKEQAETLARVARQTAECGLEGLSDARELLHSALTRAESAESRRELLHATFRESWDKDTLASLSDWLDLAEAKTHLPEAEIVAFFRQMPTQLRQKIGYQPDHADWWYRLTDFLEEKQAWPHAEAAYRKAIQLDPKSGNPWCGLGNLLAQYLGRYAEAEAAYRKAIELDPKSTYPWNGLGNLLTQYPGRYAEAEAAYRKAIGLDPKSTYPWNGLGNLLAQYPGRYAEAEAAYRKAIELDPKLANPWYGLGILLMQYPGRYAEAEAAYRKAIELDPKSAYPWNSLGNLLTQYLGRYAEAEAAYRKAIELDPKSAYPWNSLGNLVTQYLGRYAEAEAAYRKAIGLDPKSAIPWNGLGNLLKNHFSRYPEAEAAYRRAIELDLKYASPWNNLGNLLKDHLGRPAEAEAAYRKAIELDPKSVYPWSGLADLLAKQGHREVEARACAVKALPLKPDYGFARYIFLHLCAEQTNDWRAVLPALAAWCAANPKANKIFDFTVDGFLRLARFTKPTEALALLDTLPDPAPFETLRDAFQAHSDLEHLNRLAPERRELAIELLKRLAPPQKPA
jgi:tetratricopeptide (TPR) repeat protein